MGKVKVESLVRNGSVFVRLGDIIKALYADLPDVDDPNVKQYIKDSVEKWESYEDSVIHEHNNK